MDRQRRARQNLLYQLEQVGKSRVSRRTLPSARTTSLFARIPVCAIG